MINPYTPGAGTKPAYLAGRESTLENAHTILKDFMNGGMARHTIYYGLRGVGKTVLLNEIEDMSYKMLCAYKHIEVKEKQSLSSIISLNVKQIIKRMSGYSISSIKEIGAKIIGVLKAFNATWNVEDNTISFGLSNNVDEMWGTADSGCFSDDLTTLLETFGEFLQQCESHIIFFIDEIQYIKDDELEALLYSIHRINQLRLPILFIGAGLPKILSLAGNMKSYSERLFEFIKIDSLLPNDAMEALNKPIEKYNIIIDESAMNEIIRITGNYPYFLQQLGSVVWTYKTLLSDTLFDITKQDIINCEQRLYDILDNSFFRVRMDRMTLNEQEFVFAMAKCSGTPCNISEVAMYMNKDVGQISPIRAQLIHKGMIYSVRHGVIDFTVPHFDKFLNRTKINV